MRSRAFLAVLHEQSMTLGSLVNRQELDQNTAYNHLWQAYSELDRGNLGPAAVAGLRGHPLAPALVVQYLCPAFYALLPYQSTRGLRLLLHWYLMNYFLFGTIGLCLR